MTTDYRVVAVDVLGPRSGLTRVWQIHTGPYSRILVEVPSRQEALLELARLVNASTAPAGEEEGAPQ